MKLLAAGEIPAACYSRIVGGIPGQGELPKDVPLLKARDLWCVGLFFASLAFFVDRGPYRAIRFSTTGDFSTVYAAARCWLHGENPYERLALKSELAEAGAPPAIQHDQDVNPSVYLPATMPWAAPIAWMSWRFANVVWCGLSVALFGVSLWRLLGLAQLSARARWLVASLALLFSPTYVGVYDGNPGVLAISLIVLSIWSVFAGRMLTGGILLGIALCFKPQLALCALCVFTVWRSWRPILYAVLLFCMASLIAIVVLSAFGCNRQWWQTEQRNVAISFEPGGPSDPAPASAVAWQMLNAQTLTSYIFKKQATYNAAVWILAAGLTAAFLYLRKKREPARWLDAAFFAPLILTITYHRYYDAQLLLLLLPLLVYFWRGERLLASIVCACLLVLAFPVQSLIARWLGPEATVASLKQVIFLRNQPIAVLALVIALALSCVAFGSSRNSRAIQ
jgi:hypothetical protein